jgi:hypothetical protein
VIKAHDMEDERGGLIPRVSGTVAKIRTRASEAPGTRIDQTGYRIAGVAVSRAPTLTTGS